MKKFKFLTLTLLVLAICMTSVSATAALEVAQPTYDAATKVVTVTAQSEAGAADATIIATRQAAESNGTPNFTEADVLASIVYIDQIPAAAEMSVSFAPARVQGDWVSVYMAGAGASGIVTKNVSVAAVEVSRTLTLNTNGGTVSALKTYPVEGYELPSPTKTGYTFVGWFNNEGLTGTAVTEITAEEAAIGGAKQFWAKWNIEAESYTYDSGFVTDEKGVKTGVISTTAKYNATIGEVQEYGFYVYRTYTAGDDRNDADVALSKVGDAKEFYTVVYGIPEGLDGKGFDEAVFVLPFVKVGGKYYISVQDALTVNSASQAETPQDLGTYEGFSALINPTPEQ